MSKQTGIKLKLVGTDGNAFAVMGAARYALRKHGRNDLVEEFLEECTTGDYNHLLATCMEWFDVE